MILLSSIADLETAVPNLPGIGLEMEAPEIKGTVVCRLLAASLFWRYSQTSVIYWPGFRQLLGEGGLDDCGEGSEGQEC